uniref:Uncharacterized protein n=1 Tax=Strongyloides stercoralis TaxID=6248 RepID=A0AAF5HZ64_STRER
METVVEGIGSCCSTGAESKTCKLLLGGIHLELMLVMIVKPDIIVAVLEAVIQLELNLENKDFSGRNSRIHYYYCFGGCNSTGTKSGAFRLHWSNFGNVALLQLNLKNGSFFVKD